MPVRMLVAVALTALLAAPACRTGAVVETEKTLADLLISDEQELQIGRQLHQELGHQGQKYVTDPVVVNHVQQVAAPILEIAKRERPNMDWHVHVIDDPKQINAFATPGGHLYLLSGLLLEVGDDAELAGVIAHEAGHVVARHSARSLVQRFGLESLARLALGEDPGMAAGLAAQVAGTGAMLHHSRSAEHESDEIAAQYTARAGYDPQGMIRFLQRLRARHGSTTGLATWLSTHPANDARIAELRQYIARNGLRGNRGLGQSQLAAVKQRLGAGAAIPAGPAATRPPQPQQQPSGRGTRPPARPQNVTPERPLRP